MTLSAPPYAGVAACGQAEPTGPAVADSSSRPVGNPMSKTYYEKLRDPRWQRKRLEAMQAAEFRCQMCYDSESPLHVHHKAYFKGREPWEYDIEQLSVLCEECHADEHETDDAYSLVGSYLPLDGPRSRRDAAVMVLGAMIQDPELQKSLLDRLFPEQWKHLPFQLAYARMAHTMEWAFGWRKPHPDLLSLPEAIEADPQGFEAVLRQFVANWRSGDANA